MTIVGYGNSKNRWNGYAEVELCTHETPVEAPEVEVETPETEPEAEATNEFTELPFPEGRKGFNVVNQWVHLKTECGCSGRFSGRSPYCGVHNTRWNSSEECVEYRSRCDVAGTPSLSGSCCLLSVPEICLEIESKNSQRIMPVFFSLYRLDFLTSLHTTQIAPLRTRGQSTG